VNNNENAEKKMFNFNENMVNAKDSDDNMFNDKVSAEKMSNGKNSVGNMFNFKHLVETPFNAKVSVDGDSVENLFNHKVSADNIFNTNNPFKNMCNVLYDKLFPQSVKHEETKTCCCPRDRISTKLSYRLKKSSAFPYDLAEKGMNQEACYCECLGRNMEREIKKIIDELRSRKLKLAVRL
jgi:hypothetical protein